MLERNELLDVLLMKLEFSKLAPFTSRLCSLRGTRPIHSIVSLFAIAAAVGEITA
jgi:hypothetical protein